MSSSEFKILVYELLQAMGYYISWVAPLQKESGQVDMIASSDPLGIKSPRIVIHVSHKGQVMTVEGLDTLVESLKPDDHGILISSSGFTNQVKEEALVRTNPFIHLIDLEDFIRMWVKYSDKLSLEARHSLPLKAVYFLSTPD
jgi:restriction system protein